MSTIPDYAPSRTVRPGKKPSPAAAHALFAREGVGATNLDALMRYAAECGWVWRLSGGRNYPRCWTATVASWVSRDPWAESWGDGLGEAMTIPDLHLHRPPRHRFVTILGYP